MNHQKIYESIIQKAKSENRKRKNGYYENHHILPRCLGGLDNKENLVLLTAKEHYVCHKLLTYIYPTNSGITLAFCYMIHGTKKQLENRKYVISSRDYAYMKELRHLNGFSKEHKKRISEGKKGKSIGLGKHHSEETKKKIKEKRKLQICTDETRKKMSESRKGVKLGRYMLPKWVKEEEKLIFNRTLTT